jgi:hypothetical protein
MEISYRIEEPEGNRTVSEYSRPQTLGGVGPSLYNFILGELR